MALKELKLSKKLESISNTRATWVDLNKLLAKTVYKDKILEVLEAPTSNNELNVIGSHDLVEKALEFEKSVIKDDVVLTLEDTNFKNFCSPTEDQGEKISEFEMEIPGKSDKNLEVESLYTVKADYNDLLEIKSLYDACSHHNTSYTSDVMAKLRDSYLTTYSRNKEILGSLEEKKKKYRLIKFNGKTYVRALVGQNYKDYNNLVALYLGLYTFDSIARENNQNFEVEHINYTDSEFKISFSRTKASEKDVEDVFLGIDLYNNELGKGSIILAISYYLKHNGQMIHLNPSDEHKIEHRVLSIPHKINVETALDKVTSGVKDMKEFEDNLIEISTKIKNNKLTDQFVDNIISKLVSERSKKVTESSKAKIKKLRESISMTIGIANFFGKLNDLDIEFEEKEYVNYLCYKALKDWNHN